MSFDPDAYLQKKVAAPAATVPVAFDPDAYLQKKQPLPDERSALRKMLDVSGIPMGIESVPDGIRNLANPRTKAGTLLQKTGQGASFGFSDEASGLMGAVDEAGRRGRVALGADPKNPDNAPLVDGGKPLFTALLDRYRMERNSTRADLQKADEANPALAAAAEIAGSIASPVPGPGKAKAGASLMSRAVPYAAQGAAFGGLYGAGKSEADATKGETGSVVGDALANAGFGAAVGGVSGPLAEKGVDTLSDKLRKAASVRAVQAMSGNAKIVNRARVLGFKSLEDLQEFGRWALEQKLIPWSGDPAVIADRAIGILETYGPKIGAVSRRADNEVGKGFLTAGSQPARVQIKADYERAQEAAREAVRPMSPEHLDGLGAGGLRNTGPADDLIDDIADMSQQTPGLFQGMARLKTEAQDAVNWSDKAKGAKVIYRDAVQRFAKNFEDQIGEALGEGAKQELKGLNRNYGNAKDALEFTRDTSTRLPQHKYRNAISSALGPGSLMSGGAGALGAMTHDPVASIGGLGGMLVLGGVKQFLDNPGRIGRFDDAVAAALESSAGQALPEAAQKTAIQYIIDHLRRRPTAQE